MTTSAPEEPDRLHAEYIEYIKNSDVKVAYIYLIRMAERLTGFHCFPKYHGAIKEFSYYRNGEKENAISVNQNSLLFYFENPEKWPPPAALEDVFSSERVKRFANKKGQTTVSLLDLNGAKKIMLHVFGIAGSV